MGVRWIGEERLEEGDDMWVRRVSEWGETEVARVPAGGPKTLKT
jgi:hypothetical protein